MPSAVTLEVMNRTRPLLLAGLLFGSFVLTACGSSNEQAIQVYTGRHYDLEVAFTQFADETGISVEFLQGSDVELRERIAAEGNDTVADVYMTVDAGNLAQAAEQGILAAIDSPTLENAVPETLRDPGGQWFALSQRARTIVYSTDRLTQDDLPTTYEELAEPAWEGRLCLRNSTNAYTQSLVASLIANLGEEETLAVVEGWANNAEILSNDVIALNSIRDGLCDVAITNHYYLARELEADPDFPVGLLWADQETIGTHVNISGAGVVATSDSPELAQQFLEWLATDGQSAFNDGNHEFPVNPDVPVVELVENEFGSDFIAESVNASEWGLLNAEAVQILDAAGYE